MLRRVIIVLLALVVGTNILFQFMSTDTLYEEGTIDVYFCPGCKDMFIEHLQGEEQCLFYDLNDPDVLEAVADVVMFDHNALEQFPAVPSKGLMHHKFCLYDDVIITGSTNPTKFGLTRNDNNILVIESPTIAARYREEYDEIISRTNKKYTKVKGTTKVNLSGTFIELYMCPQDDCEDAVLRTLASAQQEVKFMIFTFTSDPVGDLLVQLHESGISVEGVFEKRQNSQYAEYEKLKEWGLPVFLDGNKGTMHHKVFIIDERIVITGSYNPTKSANERNDENLLIIHDEEIAKKYLAEYERIKPMS
ncbi:MAG: phospholipase D-like domain-containing protein [Candidatus Woesearchaeota archaeon]|nr:phospholipase D-like domain-containing protein [Candidatus Woesearchaeota archaeon]